MKVKDWMVSKVITVGPETSVKEAFGIMKKNGIRHLPVQKNNRLVGVVTDRDLRRPKISDVFKEWDQLYRLNDDIAVEDVMTSPAISIKTEDDLQKAASLLIEKKFGALPVVDEKENLVGILSIQDALRAFVSKFSEDEWENDDKNASL